MCNTYRITPKRGAIGHARMVSEAAAKLATSMVRKSDPGVVLRADGQVKLMHWGFHRSFNPSINNARSENMASGMWADAFHERRCAIPMSLFYEWGPGAGGKKQAHEIRAPDGDYLWVAGIWEEHFELGPCYSMITTASSPVMAPIHDRMPALLRPEEMTDFLAITSLWNLQPYSGRLMVKPCDSPLAKRKPGPDAQLDLF